jgi:hypothetical protein
VFTLLAEKMIEQKGVVFGARFDEDWEVVHDYVETKEALSVFRGSKYVQSRIGNTYQQAEQFLKSGRPVLFSGTPCQVAGLKLFLQKEYDNLLTVDFICHGVPSPKVWRKYLCELMGTQSANICEWGGGIQERNLFQRSISATKRMVGRGSACSSKSREFCREQSLCLKCRRTRVLGIAFRNKQKGWKRYQFVFQFGFSDNHR